MKLAFVIDPLERLDPTGDTSVALIEAAGQLGHETYVTEARALSLAGGRARSPLRRIRVANAPMIGVRWAAPSEWYEAGPPTEPVDLVEMDAVFLRTDPPLDSRYLWATWILDGVDPDRTTLVNDPRGVRDANEKLFALRFKALVPPTIVSSDIAEIRCFVDSVGRAVMKPIDGHAGWGVLELRAGDTNVASIVELGTDRGGRPVVVQAWVDEAAAGNRRILLWNGAVLGAVNRPVEPGDFRTGSPAEAVAPTSRELQIVATLAPELRARGLRFVGLDTIGGYLIEVNVTSPGGIRQAMGLGMPGIARDLIELLGRDRQRRRGPSPSSATRGRGRHIRGRCRLTSAQNQKEDDMSQVHQVERVMAVMAHPDDADVRAGGTIARWAADGKEVTYVIATSGNRGGDGSVPEAELAATRENEQRAAAEVLGVRHVVFLGHEDGYVTSSIELRRDITREIRRFRPEVVITHNPTRHYGYGNHPDHFAVGEATYAAIYPTARNPMAFPELRLEGLEPWEVSWSMAIDAARPNHYEDVGSTGARKLEAIARHGSQYGPEYLIAAEGIMRTHAAQAAANGHPGMELAEVYRLRFEGHPRDQFTTGRMIPG